MSTVKKRSGWKSPDSGKVLVEDNIFGFAAWVDHSTNGIFLEAAQFFHLVPDELTNWFLTKQKTLPRVLSDLKCPICHKPMAKIVIPKTLGPSFTIYLSPRSAFLWIEGAELRDFLSWVEKKPKSIGLNGSPGTTEADSLKARAPWESYVWGTWLIGSLMVLNFLATRNHLAATYLKHGFFNRDVLADNPFSWLSTCFIHLGGAHLAGNLLLISLLSPRVERDLGKINYFIFFMLCAAAGAVATCAMTPKPLASTGMGCFCLGLVSYLCLCRAPVELSLANLVGSPELALAKEANAPRIPAWLLGVIFVGFVLWVPVPGNANHYAQLGGAVAGLLTFFYTRK